MGNSMDGIDSILASIKAGSFAADDAETAEIEFCSAVYF